MTKKTTAGGAGNPEGELAKENGNVRSPARTLQLATTELWTTEEFLDAEPCDIIEISEDEVKAEIAAVSGGTDGLSPGGEPELSDSEDDQNDEVPQATSGGYNYPGPFTRYEVFDDYKTYPYRTIGKLFFERGGKRYVCSASSIGNNSIWTAGHCVHSGNNKTSGWASKVVFVPAYKDGNAPFGQWPASYLMCRTVWYQSGNPGGLTQDMGGAVLFPRNNKKISQVVGWLGFAWNWSRYQHWFSMGYPAASPFNGERMQANAASFAYNGSIPGIDSVGMGNDLTGGSSGGPWVWQWGSGNFVNGNNSYRRKNYPKEMFSPYFNNSAKSLKDALVAGTP